MVWDFFFTRPSHWGRHASYVQQEAIPSIMAPATAAHAMLENMQTMSGVRAVQIVHEAPLQLPSQLPAQCARLGNIRAAVAPPTALNVLLDLIRRALA